MTWEDEFAIEKLIKTYAQLNDRGEWDRLATLFVEDAEFTRPSAPDKPIKGRDTIIAGFKSRPPRTARHLICNTVVESTGDTEAKAHSTSVLIAQSDDSGSLISVGAFDDVVVKVDGVWLFKSRRGSTALGDIVVASTL